MKKLIKKFKSYITIIGIKQNNVTFFLLKKYLYIQLYQIFFSRKILFYAYIFINNIYLLYDLKKNIKKKNI